MLLGAAEHAARSAQHTTLYCSLMFIPEHQPAAAMLALLKTVCLA
jgi:hypothetical protein